MVRKKEEETVGQMGREISDRSKQAFVGGRRRERRIYDKTSFDVRPLDKIQQPHIQ